ncbi:MULTISPECIES: cysteine desulfurase family protein [Mesorhizobium]|uniref:Cysteine desulfurase n=1 Tax=Mesorhizobium denitrificans TaxID=2294114 RepID=A0A371X6M5_9HYPH|nr:MULTISPECIES: cysteine desulfurase family protein [Mesorhizobium]RFC64866.1 cysteine desulfurase [Mesorhizobium denitrificans]
MNGRRAYLDHNASAPLLDAARAAMVAAMDLTGNPSSVHGEGRKVRQSIESARRDVAALVNTKPEHIVFTSGATEAAMTVLTPDWQMGRSPVRMSHLYVCATDHPCILNGGRFTAAQVGRIGVDGQGIVDLAALQNALAEHNRDEGLPLVAIHAVNNETGVVQPVNEIAAVVRQAGGVLVLDAAQAGGRIVLDLASGIADYILLSAHKMGGPKGIGAIAAASDLMMPKPLVTGGGQEKGHRAGTENPVAIAGFGAAAVAAARALSEIGRIGEMRDEIEARILEICPDAVIYSAGVQRVSNTTFFSVPGVKAETAQIAFDLAGVSVSAGSACSSGKVGSSHVLKAMGYGDENGALRVSIGAATTKEDIEDFTRALSGLIARRNSATRAA